MTRVALLKADYVNEDLISAHGDLPDMFRRFLSRESGRDLELESFEVRFGQFPDPQAFDAIIISGSRYSVNDTAPWIDALKRFVRLAYGMATPLIGFCFGHQLLASAFGGQVNVGAGGWNLGLLPVNVTDAPPWMFGERRRFQALFNHREQVVALPPQAYLIAGSERCPVQIFAIGREVLGVQFHPEYSIAYQEAIMAVPPNVPPEVREDALRRNTCPRGDQHMAAMLLQFLGHVTPNYLAPNCAV